MAYREVDVLEVKEVLRRDPVTMAALQAVETVVDLRSGGGLDLILAAPRRSDRAGDRCPRSVPVAPRPGSGPRTCRSPRRRSTG